jgi:hypothetical protein
MVHGARTGALGDTVKGLKESVSRHLAYVQQLRYIPAGILRLSLAGAAIVTDMSQRSKKAAPAAAREDVEIEKRMLVFGFD